MNNVFATKVSIDKVRHLENIAIDLSSKERRHLIFTGKNGSGKTSVLEGLKKFLGQFIGNDVNHLSELKLELQKLYKKKLNTEKQLNDSTDQKVKDDLFVQLNTIKFSIDDYEESIRTFGGVEIEFNKPEMVKILYRKGEFITAFFGANRTHKFSVPQGVKKVQLTSAVTTEHYLSNNFIQYIVNLKADKSFAKDDGDMKRVHAIEDWFNNFEKYLKVIFEDNTLTLEFDKENYNFKIRQKGREVFDFSTLADGHSSSLRIIMELIMRMENKKTYEVDGIVLIDEIESHLHVTLQKQILPLLTKSFPNIQFIVTTHSPFILNSISDAVVFDLEKRITAYDLSSYSYDGLVESYFQIDKYSQEMKQKVAEYENLLEKENLTDEEKEKMYRLRRYLKEVPRFENEEFSVKFDELELRRLEKQR